MPLPSETFRYVPSEAFGERDEDDVVKANDVPDQHANKGYNKATQRALHRFKTEEDELIDRIDNPEKYEEPEDFEDSSVNSMARINQSAGNPTFNLSKEHRSISRGQFSGDKEVDITQTQISRGKGAGSARKAKYKPKTRFV